MAKSDLLKEAIADAKAVKETALANAKIALQEAFAPRLERMLATRLTNEIEGEEDADAMGGEEAAMDANAADAAEMGAMGNDVGDLSIDVDGNGEFDEFDVYSKSAGGEAEMPAEEMPVSDEEMTAEYNEDYSGHEGDDGDELNLDEIIRELEGDLEGDEMAMSMEGYEEEDEMAMAMEGHGEDDEFGSDESIDEIIEAILREEDDSMIGDVPAEEEEDVMEAMEAELDAKEGELQEAYRTVKQLQGILSEVNLLNAKLLYTNKLFRNFELSENQKMKVIENFDRAGNTREVKLVFTTLAESFNKPAKKRVVKESYASRATTTTAPSKQTTQVLSEGFELANRWKKLAGLL
jgi:hypothetical protein